MQSLPREISLYLYHIEACSQTVKPRILEFALDLGAPSLRTHEAAKEVEVQR